MDCNKSFEFIQARLDGEISPEADAQLQTHLDGCAQCRRLWEFYRQLDSTVASLCQEPPERMAQGILYKISPDYAAKKAKKRPRKWRFAGTAVAAVAAAVLLVVASGGFASLQTKKTAEAEPQVYNSALTPGAAGEEDAFARKDDTASMFYNEPEDRGMPELSSAPSAEAELPSLVLYDVQPAEVTGQQPLWMESGVTDLTDWFATHGLPMEQLPEDGLASRVECTVYCYELDVSRLSELAGENGVALETGTAEQGLLYLILPQ